MVDIPITRQDDTQQIPEVAKPGDAGVDLRSNVDITITHGGGRALVSTGLAVAIPAGYAGFVQPRSGLAVKHGITVLNAPGLIDSGYRGELKVLLVNTDASCDFVIERGMRIAQLVIQQVSTPVFVEVSELDETERGTGGFGHSGTS